MGKKNTSKISVLMSVYNGEKYLNSSIQGILNQTFSDFEFLIIDDGSTDSTKKILNKYSKEDKRIKLYVNQSNLGLTKSLNILINKSEGKYIARQDVDDISTPDRFKEQLLLIEKYGFDAVTSRAKIKGRNKKIPGISFYLPVRVLIKYKNPFIHGSLLIKKDVLNKLGNYNEDFYYAQDYKLFKDLINNGYKIKNLNRTLYNLNMVENLSTKYAEEQEYYFQCAKRNITPNESYLN